MISPRICLVFGLLLLTPASLPARAGSGYDGEAIAGDPVADWIEDYRKDVGQESQGISYASCVARYPGDARAVDAYLVMPRIPTTGVRAINAYYYEAMQKDGDYVIVNAGYLSIAKDVVDVVRANVGGAEARENMRRAAAPLVRGNLKSTTSVADAFAQHPTQACELAPEQPKSK